MPATTNTNYDFDFIIIGSGFGGSVSAHRLTEKGYSVGVIEQGKRYTAPDFPKSNWNVRKFVWMPMLRLHGFFRMTLFHHAWILSGVGVGGGSLVYAATLLEPSESVWDDPLWQHLNKWREVMPAHYEMAKHMLGVTRNPYLGKADLLLKESAEAEGFGDTFQPTDVGIFFGPEGETVPDPFFGGEGPARGGCTFCGGCMVGCRYEAKNSLDKNYLYFAEKNGAQVFPETVVVDVRPINGQEDGADGYEIHTRQSTRWFGAEKRVFRCKGVVFSGGVIGTVKLMLTAKARGSLPRLSERVGEYIRTNSESIIGVRKKGKDYDISDGIAIGSRMYIDEHTHIEAVRYPKGSDVMGLAATLMTARQEGVPRVLTWLANLIRNPLRFLKATLPFGFGKEALILLVMQSTNNYMRVRMKRSWLSPFRRKLETEMVKGSKVPTYIPQANEFVNRVAKRIDAIPMTGLTEILFDVPTSAHLLGGAPMGASAAEGVIDHRNRVFNYKNMYVCDGSMIGANLGVNPSLSITALSEHAMSYIQPAEQTDWNDTAEEVASSPQVAPAAERARQQPA